MSARGKVVDAAIAEIVQKGVKTITITKNWILLLDEKIKAIAKKSGIKSGLTIERLKKALEMKGIRIKSIEDCAKKLFKDRSWDISTLKPLYITL